jgi:CBS domain-containing protein
MKTVQFLLQQKGHHVYSIKGDTSVYDALQLMMDKNISALLIMEGDDLQGIFTERDYARKIILQGKSSKETPVKEVMTAALVTVSPHDSIEECMQRMTDQRFRHLPVLDDGAVAGMVSIGDLVKCVIDDQKHTIRQLEQYISG